MCVYVCACGLLPPLWIPHFSNENTKECVCVCSFPPPWILKGFIMKTIRNACVWTPFLLLGLFIISL